MLTCKTDTLLGNIPNEWDAVPLRSVLSFHKGGDWGEDSGEVETRVLRSTNFTAEGLLDLTDVATRYLSKNVAEKLSLQKGDLLLERSGGGPTQPVGRIAFVREDMREYAFSNFVQLLRPNSEEINNEYLGWVLFEINRSGVVERLQHQTTQMRNLDYRDYIRLLIPKPPESEQGEIAKVINAVDEAVTKTKGEIAATERLKNALLQQLFTRGLAGKHQQFKQTKIGEIPEEWEVLRIKDALSESPFNGVSPQSREEPPGTPILNVTCIYDGLCDPAYVTYVDVDKETFDECTAQKGDFFVLRGNGNREYVATGGLLRVEPDPPCIFSDKLIRLRFNSEHVIEGFIPWMWQSNSFIRRLQSKAESGSGLWMMSKRDIKRELFARPSLEEQEKIVEILETIIAEINSLKLNLEVIAYLKKALLQNLLTGKVRVRV